jgi:hypothetical protein
MGLAMGTQGRSVRDALCALALAVPLLAGCAGAGGDGEAPEPEVESQSASGTESTGLEASAPDGEYAASYVLESSNVPGAKKGFKSSSTYDFTLDECDDTECTGTVKAPAEGSYTWDGTDLVVTFDKIDKTDHCVDDSGQQMEDATYRTTTEHRAKLTAPASDEPPAKLEGSYEQQTVFSELKNGCDPAGANRQQAKFTLMLQRK